MSDLDFAAWQQQLSAHIRSPQLAPPEGIDDRRLNIYRDLFYNNIESFLRSGFPVLHSILEGDCWQALARDFLANYHCQTPYFLEISQEFLRYLQQRDPALMERPFMLELAHYEWVELALDVAEDEIDWPAYQDGSDLLGQVISLSPLAWPLAYQFPVQQIGVDYQPSESGEPTYLVVYRDRQQQVQFMQINAVTARLLELCRDNQQMTLQQLLDQLSGELGWPSSEPLWEFARPMLEEFCAKDLLRLV